MRIFILCVLSSLATSLAAAALPACQPSRACALERAKLLVHEQVVSGAAFSSTAAAPYADLVQLLSTLTLLDPRDYRSGFTRNVLNSVKTVARRDALLQDVARNLILQQRDAAALPMVIDIKATATRDALYQEMALGHARAQRFGLAHWTAARMQDSALRDAVLLIIVDSQLLAGLAEAAAQSAEGLLEGARESPRIRDDVLRIRAQDAARTGNARAALALAGRIAAPQEVVRTLQSIVELQIERNERADALATVRLYRERLRRRGALQVATAQLAEHLALLGATAEALELAQGSEAQKARILAAIAIGAARDQRFEDALNVLERIAPEQRAAARYAAGFVAQQRAVHGIDFASAFDAAHAFSPLTTLQRSRLVRDTALQLVRKDNLPRARDALNYEIEVTLQEPECSTDCQPPAEARVTAASCGDGFREESLCSIAILQARLGFIIDADRTAILLRSDQALISVLLAMAQAQNLAGRTALVRRTFAQGLALARRTPNTDRLDEVLKAYATWVADHPLHQDALADLYAATRQLIELHGSAACLADKAPLAVAAAYASAGRFTTAFAMADTQLRCQQVTAYLRIHERGKR